MLYRLEGGLGGKIEDRGDTGGHSRAKMGDMVDLKSVERYAFGETYLDFVGRNDSTNEIAPGPATLLGDRQDRRNVIAWMAAVEIEKIVVIIEFSNRRAIGPRRPFAMECLARRQADDGRPADPRVRESLRAGTRDGIMIERRRRGCSVVNQTVDDNRHELWLDGDGIGGDFRDPPGKLRSRPEFLAGSPDAHLVLSHLCPSLTQVPTMQCSSEL
jgi:hypothetical protein